MPAARAFRERRSHFFPNSPKSTALRTPARREEFHPPATHSFSVPCRPHVRPFSPDGAPASAAFSDVCASTPQPSPLFSCVCAIKGGGGTPPSNRRKALSNSFPAPPGHRSLATGHSERTSRTPPRWARWYDQGVESRVKPCAAAKPRATPASPPVL